MRYEWVRFAGAPESTRSRAGGGEVGKVAEARFQALNDGWLPVQDKGAAAFLMLYSKLLFFSDFWAAFCMRALSFLFLLFFLCLRLNYTSPGAVSDCCNSLITNWDFCIKQLCGAHQTSRKLELLLHKRIFNKPCFVLEIFTASNLLANDKVIGLLGAPFSHSPGWELGDTVLLMSFTPFSAPGPFIAAFIVLG